LFVFIEKEKAASQQKLGCKPNIKPEASSLRPKWERAKSEGKTCLLLIANCLLKKRACSSGG
jgi:hypothetical protein